MTKQIGARGSCSKWHELRTTRSENKKYSRICYLNLLRMISEYRKFYENLLKIVGEYCKNATAFVARRRSDGIFFSFESWFWSFHKVIFTSPFLLNSVSNLWHQIKAYCAKECKIWDKWELVFAMWNLNRICNA